MMEFILSLIKYTAMFICILYTYTRLLRIKLKVRDLFDIPLFTALSAVLHFVTLYIKILVPIGFLIFGIVFLFLRFRKTFYETVTVGTIALGISIVIYVLATILDIPIAITLYLIKNEIAKNIITQLSVSIVEIVGSFLLFKIKRLQSGVNPKGETATFEILLFFSVACVFIMTLFYTNQSLYEIVALAVAFCGLLLIAWWRRYITYSYREAVKRQNTERLENTIEEYETNSAEKDFQDTVLAKLFHYLNKALPDCAMLAEGAAAETGNKKVCEARDMFQGILGEMKIASEKCSFKGIPQTGAGEIDAPIIRLFTLAEKKNFDASAEICTDVKGWFTENELDKHDIHILLTYLLDNAVISALGAPNAKVRAEFGATIKRKPLFRIYDSGEQFDEEVLAKLGSEQITTRVGAGGSGIGLFTVFEILEKYRASFTLDEAAQNFGFTKFIEIAFDGRHSVTVRTCRENVVKVCAARKGFTVERIESPDAA